MIIPIQSFSVFVAKRTVQKNGFEAFGLICLGTNLFQFFLSIVEIFLQTIVK
jgi:hypothetical protein